MSGPRSPQRPTASFPSTAYLVVTAVVAVVGLGLALAAVVPSIVAVLSMLPLLVGLQQIGVRERAERHENSARRRRETGLD